MQRQTLTSFGKFGIATRRARSLLDMDRIVRWAELAAA